jgi:NAD-dependent dihydropyrimidine dehydrogenase PreA subunit
MPNNEIVSIDRDSCTACGVCVNMCPKGILYIDERSGKCSVTDHAKCDRLGGCERACPVQAIKII